MKLRALLYNVLNDKNTTHTYPPIVGICFGHQIIANALGIKVDRNPNGFEGGIVKIKLNNQGKTLFGLNNYINLAELHNDVVFDIPEEYINWGETDKCSIQGLYKPFKVLTFQGHPEFTNDIVINGVKHMYDENNTIPYNEIVMRSKQVSNQGHIAARAIWSLFHKEI